MLVKSIKQNKPSLTHQIWYLYNCEFGLFRVPFLKWLNMSIVFPEQQSVKQKHFIQATKYMDSVAINKYIYCHLFL